MGDHLIETYHRSRSNTPFLRSACDHEFCEHALDEAHVHHKKKSNTNVQNTQTIIEEAVEVTSSSSSVTGNNVPKAKTSDYSSEDASSESTTKTTRFPVVEIRRTLHGTSARAETPISLASSVFPAGSVSSFLTTTASSSSTTTTVTTRSRKVISGGSSVATSTPKAMSYMQDDFAARFADGSGGADGLGEGRRLNEITQNFINTEFERSQKTSAIGADQRRPLLSGFLGHSYTSTSDKTVPFDASDHLAYLEYKRAGEYWKTTPKTDYTYSELSPHRRELAPGIVAMPNMSRPSLEKHHERIGYMIERDPVQEEYIRRRYESSKYRQEREMTEKLAYDSGDELDYGRYQQYRKYDQYLYGSYKPTSLETESWFTRMITTIVTIWSSMWSTISGGDGGYSQTGAYLNRRGLYHTRLAQEKRGFFGSLAHGISSALMAVFRYIYIFISSVLYLDTWLLRSSNAENRSRKRFLLLLLMLLPLLLLAAWSLLDEDERLYYLQRTQTLLPLPLLAALKSTFHTTAISVRGLLNLPVFTRMVSHPNDDNMERLQMNVEKALSPEEYENILNHINSYVQKLVELKVREQYESAQQITPQQTQVIAQVMRENLEKLARQKRFTETGSGRLGSLSDADLQALATQVQLKLEESGWLDKPVKLSRENVEEIKRLIGDSIEVNNRYHYSLLVERIDLEALLGRILKAPILRNFVDERIALKLNEKLSGFRVEGSGDHSSVTRSLYDQQQLLINELNKEIALIKLSLSSRESVNEDFQQSLNELKLSQDDLLKRIEQFELATDKRYSALLAEIETKLAALKDDYFVLMNRQIKLSLLEILGFKQLSADGAQLDDLDLEKWVHNTFVAKDYLEQRLLEINNRTNNQIRNEIDRSGMLLWRDISARLKQDILRAVEAKRGEGTVLLKDEIRGGLSEEEVRNIVKSVLAVYDADKTGLVDFALESAGGQILSTRCTENYQTKSAQLSIFGIPLWYPANTPRVAISPNVQPGECWAFQGFPGFLVLKLNSMVYVTGFTLEHIPKSLTPNGRIDSAPRNFTVWGLEHEKDQEPVLFGKYEYVDNDASLQYFAVQNKNITRPYEIVELRIESNHGHNLYTCLYRFRVHGRPPPVESPPTE